MADNVDLYEKYRMQLETMQKELHNKDIAKQEQKKFRSYWHNTKRQKAYWMTELSKIRLMVLPVANQLGILYNDNIAYLVLYCPGVVHRDVSRAHKGDIDEIQESRGLCICSRCVYSKEAVWEFLDGSCDRIVKEANWDYFVSDIVTKSRANHYLYGDPTRRRFQDQTGTLKGVEIVLAGLIAGLAIMSFYVNFDYLAVTVFAIAAGLLVIGAGLNCLGFSVLGNLRFKHAIDYEEIYKQKANR